MLNQGSKVRYVRKSSSRKGYYVVQAEVKNMVAVGYIDSAALEAATGLWYKIEWNGGQGWVSSSSISLAQ